MIRTEQRILRGDPDADVIAEVSMLPLPELKRLMRHPNRDVRWFLIANAPVISPTHAPDLLEESFLRDGDEDNRIDALSQLAAVAPDRARRHLSRIRRRLKNEYWATAMSAIWLLLRLRDLDALPALEDAAKRWEGDGVGRAAAIAVAGLRGQHDALARRLLSHSHDETPWLAYAAASLGTPELLATVTRAATELPDEECRYYCRQALDQFGRHPTGL